VKGEGLRGGGVQSFVGQRSIINRCIEVGEQAKGCRRHGPRIYPLSRGQFWPYLANAPDQIQQARIILSIALCRGIQGEKTLNTDV